MAEFHVSAFWDPEIEMWVASGEDIPGLVAEAASADELLARLRNMIPGRLAQNGLVASRPIAFDLTFEEIAPPLLDAESTELLRLSN